VALLHKKTGRFFEAPSKDFLYSGNFLRWEKRKIISRAETGRPSHAPHDMAVKMPLL
jgi:hypothetical protein